ncbi:MAG: GDP-mannose 4,6-dehydratase [Candidatus Microgenomates bacterium]|jgi:GDP-4-dehydro-6-deoxy-D-mannose reductase
MQKVLITGVAGFVGHYLTESLLEDYRVTGTDKAPLSPNSKIDYFPGDILDRKFLGDLISKQKPEVIFHLAAKSQTWSRNVEEVFKINMLGTINLYESILEARENSDYNPKIIFISSSEVYGNTTDPKNITEDSPLFPIKFYSASKVAADRLSYSYSQNEKLNILILRPFTHTGPGQQKGFFVPDICSQIAEVEKGDKNELLVGNLDSVRDYLDVRDVVAGYKTIINKDWVPGESFNICSGHGIKIRAMLEILLKLSDKKFVTKEDPSKIRESDAPVYIGNNRKFREATDWKPQISIEKTLKDTLNYWRNLPPSKK